MTTSTSNGKTCNRCGEWKPFTDFFLNKHMPDGYLNQCKRCYNGNRKSMACEEIKCPHFRPVPSEYSAKCAIGGKLKFFLQKLHWRGVCPENNDGTESQPPST